jgi:hypothetical protein
VAGSGTAAAASAVQAFAPVADGFVSADASRVSHGRARSLRLGVRPPSRAYLRFQVSDLAGAVVSAELRVFVTRSGPGRLQVRAVARRRWTERSLTYRSAPRLGRVLATAPAQRGWASFDVSSFVRGAGTFDLALLSKRGTVDVASREARRKPALRVKTAPLLLAAGDVSSCRSTGDEATGALIEDVPATVAALGDLAYPRGTADEFINCYGPSWGPFSSTTRPAVGNHEYATPGAAAYFDYFGAAAGPRGAGYYSYELGSWHVIVLNSNCRFVPCEAGSLQETWLRSDLATHRTLCTLAYFHHPLFSSTLGTATPGVRPLWQALYEGGADVVLNGHAHNYQRFAPQTPAGAADPARGIREFVVGTGGDSHHVAGPPIPNQETTNDTTFGVLRLSLLEGRYLWRFLPVSGGVFADAGSSACH